MQPNAQTWNEKPKADEKLSATATGDTAVSATAAETVTNRLGGMHISDNSGTVLQDSKAIWKPKSYGTASGATTTTTAEVESTPASSAVQQDVASTQKSSAGLSKLFQSNLLENFTVDNSSYSLAQIRATFYPKFENEKSDQEVYDYMLSFILCA